jgi:hypothetical protein
MYNMKYVDTVTAPLLALDMTTNAWHETKVIWGLLKRMIPLCNQCQTQLTNGKKSFKARHQKKTLQKLKLRTDEIESLFERLTVLDPRIDAVGLVC